MGELGDVVNEADGKKEDEKDGAGHALNEMDILLDTVAQLKLIPDEELIDTIREYILGLDKSSAVYKKFQPIVDSYSKKKPINKAQLALEYAQARYGTSM